jgi:hypothetical protein
VTPKDSVILKSDSAINTGMKGFSDYSLFSSHKLKSSHSKDPILTNSPVLYWPSVLLFIVFCIYVSVKVTDPKKIIKIFMSVFSIQASKQLIREDYKLYKRVSVFLSVCFILVISFLICLINDYFGLILKSYNLFHQYLFFILITTFIYLTKIVSTLILAHITSSYEIGKEYIFNLFVFCQITGVILFPVVVFIQFSKYPTEWFLYPGLIVCASIYMLRIFRGFVISALEQNIGILYIILYLCALEILPLLVLVRFLLINF